MGILLCLAWQERQINGWAVSVCPTKITNTTPIKVRMGPTPKITHFDFNKILRFLTVMIDLNHSNVCRPFMGLLPLYSYMKESEDFP
jgi:hypothetical protein